MPLGSGESAVEACLGAAVVDGCVGLDDRSWPERWPPLCAGMGAGVRAAEARFMLMVDPDPCRARPLPAAPPGGVR